MGLVGLDDRCAAAWCAAAARARILLPLPPSLLPPGRPGPSSTGGLTWPPPASNSPRWAVSDRPPNSAHAEEEESHLVSGLSHFHKWVRESILAHESRVRKMNLSLSSPAVEQEKSQQGMNLLLLQQMYQPVLSGSSLLHFFRLIPKEDLLCPFSINDFGERFKIQ